MRRFRKIVSILISFTFLFTNITSATPGVNPRPWSGKGSLRAVSFLQRGKGFAYGEFEGVAPGVRVAKLSFSREGREAQGYAVVLDPNTVDIGVWVSEGAQAYDFMRQAIDQDLADRMGRKYVPPQGKTVQQFRNDVLPADENERTVLVVPATQGGYWTQNTAVIVNGELKLKTAPGIHQTEDTSPVTSLFFQVFDAGNVGIRAVEIKNGKPKQDISNVSLAIAGPPLIRDGENRAQEIEFVGVGESPVQPWQVNWDPKKVAASFSSHGNDDKGHIVHVTLVGLVYPAEIAECNEGLREKGVVVENAILGPGGSDCYIDLIGHESLIAGAHALSKTGGRGRPTGAILYATTKRGESSTATAAFMKDVRPVQERQKRNLAGDIKMVDGRVVVTGRAGKTVRDFAEFLDRNKSRWLGHVKELLEGGATIRVTMNLGDAAEITAGGRVVHISEFLARQFTKDTGVKPPLAVLDKLVMRNELVHRDIQSRLGERRIDDDFAIEVLAAMEELKGAFELSNDERRRIYRWINSLNLNKRSRTNIDEFFALADELDSEDDMYTTAGLTMVGLHVAKAYPDFNKFAELSMRRKLPRVITSVLMRILKRAELPDPVRERLAHVIQINAPPTNLPVFTAENVGVWDRDTRTVVGYGAVPEDARAGIEKALVDNTIPITEVLKVRQAREARILKNEGFNFPEGQDVQEITEKAVRNNIGHTGIVLLAAGEGVRLLADLRRIRKAKPGQLKSIADDLEILSIKDLSALEALSKKLKAMSDEDFNRLTKLTMPLVGDKGPLQISLEAIAAMAKNYDIDIPVVLVVSKATEPDIERILRENTDFGLKNIAMVYQDTNPVVTSQEGKFLVINDELRKAPDGTGGAIEAVAGTATIRGVGKKQSVSGVEWFRQQGCSTTAVVQGDMITPIEYIEALIGVDKKADGVAIGYDYPAERNRKGLHKATFGTFIEIINKITGRSHLEIVEYGERPNHVGLPEAIDAFEAQGGTVLANAGGYRFDLDFLSDLIGTLKNHVSANRPEFSAPVTPDEFLRVDKAEVYGTDPLRRCRRPMLLRGRASDVVPIKKLAVLVGETRRYAELDLNAIWDRVKSDGSYVQSISGIRYSGMGLGKTIEPEDAAIAFCYGYNYARLMMDKFPDQETYPVVVGRDPRSTGEAVAKNQIRGFLKAAKESGKQIEVINLGIATTPLFESAIRTFKAAGGVMITASHNPVEYNGYKYATANIEPKDSLLGGGSLIDARQADRVKEETTTLLRKACEMEINLSVMMGMVGEEDADELLAQRNTEEDYSTAIDGYVAELQEFGVNVAPGVILVNDCNGGSAARTIPELLEKLGIGQKEAVSLNTVIGEPQHLVEPIGPPPGVDKRVRRTNGLIDVIRELLRQAGKAKFGIAYDYDADRGNLVLYKPDGRSRIAEISPQDTAMLNVAIALMKSQNYDKKEYPKGLAVVGHCATSGRTKETARIFQAEYFTAEVGEVNVAKKMAELEAEGYYVPIAVEGYNGGTLFRGSRCRDGLQTLLAAASVLSDPDLAKALFNKMGKLTPEIEKQINEGGLYLTQVVDALPRYISIQAKITGVALAPDEFKKAMEARLQELVTHANGVYTLQALGDDAVYSAITVGYSSETRAVEKSVSVTAGKGLDEAFIDGGWWISLVGVDGHESKNWVGKSKTETDVYRTLVDSPDPKEAKGLDLVMGALLFEGLNMTETKCPDNVQRGIYAAFEAGLIPQSRYTGFVTRQAMFGNALAGEYKTDLGQGIVDMAQGPLGDVGSVQWMPSNLAVSAITKLVASDDNVKHVRVYYPSGTVAITDISDDEAFAIAQDGWSTFKVGRDSLGEINEAGLDEYARNALWTVLRQGNTVALVAFAALAGETEYPVMSSPDFIKKLTTLKGWTTNLAQGPALASLAEITDAYIQANHGFLRGFFERAERPGGNAVLRLPLEVVSGASYNMKRVLLELGRKPGVYIELYSMHGGIERAHYKAHGLESLYAKNEKMSEELKEPTKRSTKNTVTLMLTHKERRQNELVEDFNYLIREDKRFQRSVLVPIGRIKDGDSRGLIRGFIFGLRCCEAARHPDEEGFIDATAEQYQMLVTLQGALSETSLEPLDVKKLTINIDTVPNSRKKAAISTAANAMAKIGASIPWRDPTEALQYRIEADRRAVQIAGGAI